MDAKVDRIQAKVDEMAAGVSEMVARVKELAVNVDKLVETIKSRRNTNQVDGEATQRENNNNKKGESSGQAHQSLHRGTKPNEGVLRGYMVLSPALYSGGVAC
jgi:outer membrane murein-binding lipoprotein Lpp